MSVEAVTKALQDARLNHADIKQACVGYVYGNNCVFYIFLKLACVDVYGNSPGFYIISLTGMHWISIDICL